MINVYIDGSAGTTGLRIRERLAEREDVRLLTIPEEYRKDPDVRAEKMNASDITFLCLPDDAAREAVKLITNPHVRVLDTSTAHRTMDGWTYGFPELSPAHREACKTAKRVAVPGCHASGFMALVYPLVAGGIAPKDYPFVCYSITGYSGGGKKMIAEYEDKDRAPELDSPRQYGTTQQHKHLKEMKAIAGLAQEPIFAPIVGDFYSGMTVSVPVFGSQLQKKMTVASMKEYFMNYYAGNPMIQVLEETPAYIGTNNMSGRDSMEIMVSGNDDRILLAARFDNLGKGASGAAIQCMNIMLGLDETTGLER
jgi:N-acetyl-gamma-glutamyl-phosphate reductase